MSPLAGSTSQIMINKMAAPTNRKNKIPQHSQNVPKLNKNISEHSDVKRTFNKKLWRSQKYKKNIGNLIEGQGFAEKRKQLVMREYHKILKKEKLKASTKEFKPPIDLYTTENKSTGEGAIEDSGGKGSKKKVKLTAYKRAQLEYKRQREEKEKQKQELARIQQERDSALKKYKDNKLERTKKLSRKTRKGQPVMKDRMELLLERIQQQMAYKH